MGVQLTSLFWACGDTVLSWKEDTTEHYEAGRKKKNRRKRTKARKMLKISAFLIFKGFN